MRGLQEKIIQLLVEKLPEFMHDAPDEMEGVGSRDCMAMLLLNQFRWLDNLVFSEALVSKLLEVLDILPLGLKRATIVLLPEILSEGDSTEVVEKLLDILENEMDLAGTVLESLSSLNVDSTVMDEVVNRVLKNVGSVHLKDLPRMVRFLVLSASENTVADVVEALRQKLSTSDSGRAEMNEKKNQVALTLDALRQSTSHSVHQFTRPPRRAGKSRGAGADKYS